LNRSERRERGDHRKAIALKNGRLEALMVFDSV